jgi:hypothetical protein
MVEQLEGKPGDPLLSLQIRKELRIRLGAVGASGKTPLDEAETNEQIDTRSRTCARTGILGWATLMVTVGGVEVVVELGGVLGAPPVPAKTEAASGPTAPLAKALRLKSLLWYPWMFPRAAARAFGSTKFLFRSCSDKLSSISVSSRES